MFSILPWLKNYLVLIIFSIIPNIIGFKEQEVLVHKAAIGHTGSLEHEIDYKDMNGASGHGICIHIVKTNI